MPLEYLNKNAMSQLPDAEYVYVIQDLDISGHVKIGRTKNPQQRFYDFGVKLPFEVGIIRVIPTLDAVKLERELHDKYAGKRAKGEWFNLNDKEKLELLCMAGDATPASIQEQEPEAENHRVENSEWAWVLCPDAIRQVDIISTRFNHSVEVVQLTDKTIHVLWVGNWGTNWLLRRLSPERRRIHRDAAPGTITATESYIKLLSEATKIAKIWEKEGV